MPPSTRRLFVAPTTAVTPPHHPPPHPQVLSHPWLAAGAPQTTIDASILHQLQLFASFNRARRLMLGVAAKSLSGAEANQLLKRFLALDKVCVLGGGSGVGGWLADVVSMI